MPTVRFNRIVQNDGNLRSLSIYVNDKKVGSLKPGQEYLDVELQSGEHQLHASLTPFYKSRKTCVEISESSDFSFHVGLVYRNMLEGLLPNALKILPSEEYRNLTTPETPHVQLTSKQLTLVVVSGVCAGLLLLVAWHQGGLVPEYAYATPILGVAAIAGAFMTIYFNKTSVNSSFPVYKPILDAGALVFLMTILETNDSTYWFCGAGVLLLLALAAFIRYR